jgi:hypothetical protein
MVEKLQLHLKKKQDAILSRLFAVFTLFTEPSQSLNLLIDARSVDILLHYGLGQLLGSSTEK